MSDRIAFAGKVESEGRRIRGHVVLKGSRTFRNGEWLEVDPAALVKADASDVFALLNHDDSKVLGRTKNGTLTVTRTEDGISFETADLPNTQAANDALELARGGYFGGSSFSIEGLKSKFDYAEDGTRVRRITSIKRLFDVSPVYDPAFSNSSAAAFSKETDMGEETTEAPEQEAPPSKRETAKFSAGRETAEQPAKTGKDYWQEFAKDLTLETIEGTMDALFSESKGNLQGDVLDRYEGFAAELRDRKRADASARARIEALQFAHNAALGRVPKAPEAELFASDDYKAAFGKYIRGNVAVMEQFAQSISGDGTQGGYAVPEDFRAKITETLKAFGGIQGQAEVLETGDGRALPWPTNDDTANSAAVASEGSAPGSGGADLVLGEVSLGAFSIAATGTGNAPLKVSWELLQDAQFDFEAFVARKLGERLGRKAAALYATGVGTTEPFGLLAKTPDAMSATTFRAATVEHFFQVNEAYRNGGNCSWIMSDTTLTKVYNSVDKQGRPLFIPNAESSGAGAPAGTILGKPVFTDQGAGDLVAFGDIRAGFIIRMVRAIQVVVDPYNNTATRQNAYHAWMRTDSNIQDSAAVSVSTYASVNADTAS